MYTRTTHTRTLDVEETIKRKHTLLIDVPDGKDERYDHMVESLKNAASLFTSVEELMESIQLFYGSPVKIDYDDEGEAVEVKFDHYL